MKPKTTVKVKLNKNAIEEMERTIERHRPLKKDRNDLKKILTKDRRDLRKVLNLYKKGKWKEAELMAFNLDEIARDMIPNGIWNDIKQIK